MLDAFESLIVKVGRVMPEGVEKIKHLVLNNWKEYTMEYFSSSPNIFLHDNELYHNLSE